MEVFYYTKIDAAGKKKIFKFGYLVLLDTP